MVNKKLLLPQEIETYYVIPTIRRYFAKYLKETGMKQKDIANLLMVNTSAISQYNSTKRGNKVDFPETIKEEIKNSTVKIKDQLSYLRETQHILRVIRESKTLCQIHKQFSEVPNNCTPEEVGCNQAGMVCR